MYDRDTRLADTKDADRGARTTEQMLQRDGGARPTKRGIVVVEELTTACTVAFARRRFSNICLSPNDWAVHHGSLPVRRGGQKQVKPGYVPYMLLIVVSQYLTHSAETEDIAAVTAHWEVTCGIVYD